LKVTIPLTFDWLTLTWLRVRAALLWRRARLHPLALALLLLGIGSGCVPVTRFEETQSAAQVEMEGRRRAEERIEQLNAEQAELLARLREQQQKLEARDQALAQAELDSSNQGRKRQDAEGMVEQLRGELARVGGHLQSYHDDKQKLEASRSVETERGRALARLARDAALALGAPIATGEYALDAEAGRITLAVPREKLLAEDGSIKPEANGVLKAVSQLLALHKQTKLRIEDSNAAGDVIAVNRLVNALMEQGISAERFGPLALEAPAGDAAAAPSVAPAPAQIVFAFALP
jgi:chromosome segregation ATPase